MRTLTLAFVLAGLAILGTAAANTQYPQATSETCHSSAGVAIEGGALCRVSLQGQLVGGTCYATSCYVHLSGSARADSTAPTSLKIEFFLESSNARANFWACAATAIGTVATCSGTRTAELPVTPGFGSEDRIRVLARLTSPSFTDPGSVSTALRAITGMDFLVTSPGVGQNAMITIR